ncbi:hypothetical protein [Vibrio sp. CAU 1672]|uniref:hypothetical protein n=1 Tax=Vibrio sp. CAU 1672 TaxID=3032594 RepID=UPI0023DCA87C|nr:hypothetical protein [Vibrio sp. CAU 1672]MDF2155937.1 hypothetical protein [Vibrio sp. CAU 1672]
MRSLIKLFVVIATIAPLTTQAGGSTEGRTLAPEVKCQLPNGNIHMLPPLYCKVHNGKESK